jgi:hypothetical protein
MYIQMPIEHSTILEQINDGMAVFDLKGEHMGQVEHVFLGADLDSTQDYSGDELSATNASIWSSIIDHVLDALFGKDELPQSLRNRLINDGFIQVEGEGLFASERYILRGQVAHVSGDEVHLNVTKDELIKR